MNARLPLSILASLLFCTAALAEAPAPSPAPSPAQISAEEHPYPGVTFHDEIRKDPPQQLHWMTVDLIDPHVSLHVARGGPDPDGAGPWQTTLTLPSTIAKREGFEVTINGDFFFSKRQPKEPFKVDQWASVAGPAATDGQTWAASDKPRPCLVIKKTGTITIERLTKAEPDDAQVIAGNVLLVSNGKPVNHPKDTARHPRTVVGLDPGGTRLTILMVDGRRKNVADGMTYAELSREMIHAGCDRALNLDGGGSSILLLRQGDKWVTKNLPSESERPVASVLGIDIKDAK